MFCTGATKAGTSWLHRQIADHPECHMRAIKELHYFDALEFRNWNTWTRGLTERRDRVLAETVGATPDVLANKQRVADDAMELCHLLETRKPDDSAYLAYLTRGLSDQKLIGDFTPAYGLLPVERLRHMAGLVANVRFVYILRDPIQRLWSHARMIAGRRADSPDEIPQKSVNIVRRVMRGKEDEIEKRSDYVDAVERLRAATGPGQLYLGFYEDMFNQDAMNRLTAFLGISPRATSFDKRVHKSPVAQMRPGQWKELREFLAPQYDGLRKMLGTLPPAWGKEPMKV